MGSFLSALWPRPGRQSAEEKAAFDAEGVELDSRIRNLKSLDESEPGLHLEAARRIADEEDRRKSGAETRATTFIAAVAALIPLMTWALGNTDSSTCSKGWGCVIWAAAFLLAVVYFITAAYWALSSLAVANYHVIGVEDLVEIREKEKRIYKELIRQTLLLARNNRDTINQKLTYIKIAQRRFFNGLVVLGVLLMFDPISRFGVLAFLKSEMDSWKSHKVPAAMDSRLPRQAAPPSVLPASDSSLTSRTPKGS